jgi:predicted acyl esterase
MAYPTGSNTGISGRATHRQGTFADWREAHSPERLAVSPNRQSEDWMTAKQFPEVSEESQSIIRREATELLNAALIGRGVEDATRERMIAYLHDRLEIVPRAGGPEIRVRLKGDSLPFGAVTIARLVNEAVAESASRQTP